MFHKVNLILVVALFSFQGLFAQQNSPKLSTEEIAAYQNQCKQMMQYLEGTINFLGNPKNLPAKKEIIINDSYLKIFKNDKVQIEDDLDENREVPIRKDVQAYLKDVVFFYKQLKVSFHINSIVPGIDEEGGLYFKLTMNRNLQGITVNNDTVENNLLRYVEINLNAASSGLKIASIYTNKPNENAELRYWWNHLSQAWKNYFGKSILVYDSIPMKQILFYSDTSMIVSVKQKPAISDSVQQNDSTLIDTSDTIYQSDSSIIDTSDSIQTKAADTIQPRLTETLYLNTSLLTQIVKQLKKSRQIDISDNLNILSLAPMDGLSDLKTLNCAHTLIDDLTPLRTLNKLETLNITGCPVSTLEPLRYVSALREIDAAYTPLRKVGVIANMRYLETLNLGFTQVDSLPSFQQLKNLRTLELSSTPIHAIDSLASLNELVNLNLSRCVLDSFTPLESLKSLQLLSLDSTNFQDVSVLDSLQSLTILQINGTRVSNLMPLAALANLKYIYCDNSGIKQQEASRFNAAQPHCQVIFNSVKLERWWNELPEEWKSVFRTYTHLGEPVTKEQLHTLLQVETIDVLDNHNIHSLKALSFMTQIKKLIVSGTDIHSLNALTSMASLRELEANHTNINSLDPLKKLNNLKSISIENTKITNLLPLINNSNLSVIYVDSSRVKKKNVLAIQRHLPNCLVVYQSGALRSWWNKLGKNWQHIFAKQSELDQTPTNEQLQRLSDLKKISISNQQQLNNLEVLKVFGGLKELYIDNCRITDISPVFQLKNLEILSIRNSPLSQIEGIEQLGNLKKVDFENTSLENPAPLQNLKRLRSLNIAGTRIKNLRPLAHLFQLEQLYINNTRIGNIKVLKGLHQLKLLRCNNSGLNAKKVASFEKAHPKTRVIFY